MVTARDAYDDWYDDDEPYGDAGEAWRESSSRRLGLVRRPDLGFELVTPGDFEAAQTIADRFKTDTPVLIDLCEADRRLAGRLTDFASGLTYALDGSLQPVGEGLLLLVPGHVDLSGDDAAAVRQPGFYNRK